MLRSESIIMIREKVLEGKSAYAVSKELGFSKNTVKKYIKIRINKVIRHVHRNLIRIKMRSIDL